MRHAFVEPANKKNVRQQKENAHHRTPLPRKVQRHARALESVCRHLHPTCQRPGGYLADIVLALAEWESA